jgi:predicted enzyme related to lactoylglutathione lyase
MFHFSAKQPEVLARFYYEVFGWSFERTEAPNPTWHVMSGSPDEPGIDGMLHTRERDNSVVNTIEVSDIESVLDSIVLRGGRVIDKRAIPSAGQIALFEDPEGNVFQLRQPPRYQEE